MLHVQHELDSIGALDIQRQPEAGSFNTSHGLCMVAHRMWTRRQPTFKIAMLQTSGSSPGKRALQNTPTSCRHQNEPSTSVLIVVLNPNSGPAIKLTAPPSGVCWKIAWDTGSATRSATATGTHSTVSTLMADTQQDMTPFELPSPCAWLPSVSRAVETPIKKYQHTLNHCVTRLYT